MDKVRWQKFFRGLFIFISALVLALSPSVFAIDDATLKFNALNNIIFYAAGNNDSNRQCSPSGAPSGSQITWIGDSYTVGAQSIIESKLPGVDIHAQVSKFVSADKPENSGGESGLTILKNLVDSNSLRNYLVFALGTNGGWSSNDINKLINLAGVDTKIILVTSKIPNNDYSSSNDILEQAASSNNNISVADWTSVYNASFFTSDSIHPSSNGGYTAWFDIIYNALSSGGSLNLDSSETENNRLYNGDPVINEAFMSRVLENQQFYEKSANEQGFPWQILAVLHIREHGAQRDNPSNGQGAYQLYSYTNGGNNSNAFRPTGPISDQEFQRQTDIAAKLVSNNYGAGLDLNTENGVKRMFFKYNGASTAYKAQARDLGFSAEEAENGEGSPYVMNMADKMRDPTVNHNWRQISVDNGPMVNNPSNTNPGAYLMYLALGGIGNSLCFDTSNSGSARIAQTAIDLAWKEGESGWKTTRPTEAYRNATRESGTGSYYAACNIFVATVLRYSGYDSNFDTGNTESQRRYMENHPELFEVVEVSNTNDLRPGDILQVNGTSGHGHIKIYVEIDGQPYTAAASLDDYSGSLSPGISISSGSRGSYKVFRAKG